MIPQESQELFRVNKYRDQLTDKNYYLEVFYQLEFFKHFGSLDKCILIKKQHPKRRAGRVCIETLENVD